LLYSELEGHFKTLIERRSTQKQGNMSLEERKKPGI
jgi:hypothetical protein